ncbi:hypothetical protein [Bordetella petrii]|uniref:hypothetical protein n=1 Tax=Bordetella petrii TaxID=94624 RepID=UPI0037306B9F
METAPEHSRVDILAGMYRDYCERLGNILDRQDRPWTRTIESVVPHPRLRLMLQSDPAMAALLPTAEWRFSLGDIAHAPFCLHPSQQIVRLSPALLDDPAALAAAARWGLELARICDVDVPPSPQEHADVLRHGNLLLGGLSTRSRNLFLSLLQEQIAAAAWGGGTVHITQELVQWQHTLSAIDTPAPSIDTVEPSPELSAPLEYILTAGGDSRLRLDQTSGHNRYGVPPRPRPDAVHFSSSTASAISDYGFMFCELLRSRLLRVQRAHPASRAELIHAAADAMGQEICLMLGLDEQQADVMITASGTDAELATVLISKAGSPGRLTNILIAPDETGSGVALAGAGCYFDHLAATGMKIEKGASIWPEGAISTAKVAIRGPDGAPRTPAEIDRDFIDVGRQALERGDRVLAHVLLASKTGLVAPTVAAVKELTQIAPDRVDVVVDACQMRMSFKDLGACIERGWILQVSGSKFLTGPPFSGALVLPREIRSRLPAIQANLRHAPGVCHGELWSKWWSGQLPESTTTPSFGPLFRWLPAVMEARLLEALPEGFRREAFERFRDTLVRRIGDSPYLAPISIGGPYDKDEEFARLSIVSFEVLGCNWNGELKPLDEAECRHLFEQLNRDVSALFSDLSAAESALARQKFHIGQPVTLRTSSDSRTVLRLVIGARFFTIVGYADDGATMAALDAEIADAGRAVSKIELLASRWWRLASIREV